MDITVTQVLNVHPQNPQRRALAGAVASIRSGSIVAYPTDSGYALGCQMDNRRGLEAMIRIRQAGRSHNSTLVCRTMREVSAYARVDNDAYRWIKPYVPGPYTFILRAGPRTPRRAQNDRRKSIGVRIPEHAVVDGLLEALDEPILSTTLIAPGDAEPLADATEIQDRFGGQIGVIIDAGHCAPNPTSVIDLSSGGPSVVRVGHGDVSPFE